VDSWKGRFFSFWDLNTQTELSNLSEALRNLTGGNRTIAIENLSFSPDGRFLAIAHTSNLRLWDLENQQWLNAPFRGDIDCDNNVQSVAFSPDSQLIATRSNGSVCLRNLSGDQLARFTDNGYDTLSFSGDSRFLFTADDSNQVTQVWQIESFDELITHACTLARDYLNASSSDAVERDRSLCEAL
jgi:WD40 repeat protein